MASLIMPVTSLPPHPANGGCWLPTPQPHPTPPPTSRCSPPTFPPTPSTGPRPDPSTGTASVTLPPSGIPAAPQPLGRPCGWFANWLSDAQCSGRMLGPSKRARSDFLVLVAAGCWHSWKNLSLPSLAQRCDFHHLLVCWKRP